jgi:ubiquinone/menaquinone biosynthesis C-methylase UbiE
MDASRNGPPTDRPDRIMQMSWGPAASQIVCTALDLDVFSHVAAGRNTPAALREATGASERGLDMLLDALVGLGLVTRTWETIVSSTATSEMKDGKPRVTKREVGKGEQQTARLHNAPDVDLFLVRGRDSYLGSFVQLHVQRILDDWRHLTECVRSGKPVHAVERPEEGVPLWHQLVDTLFALNRAAAMTLARELKRRHPDSLRVLDVAAGSGVWGVACAELDPRAKVVAFDLPETLEHVRATAKRLSLGDRIEMRAGDLRHASLGEREFDAVILGHICHSEGPHFTQELFAKTARALKPGGTIAIAEFLPDDDRNGPPLPLMFALNMLVHTTEGHTFTVADLTGWLRSAGFTDVRTLDAPAPSPLILATRT